MPDKNSQDKSKQRSRVYLNQEKILTTIRKKRSFINQKKRHFELKVNQVKRSETRSLAGSVREPFNLS